jgi:undecaprenyl-diphosphatase
MQNCAAQEKAKQFPWMHQFICLAPLSMTLISIVTFIGTGDVVTLTFRDITSEHPDLLVIVKELSRWIPNLFYVAYCIILIHAAFSHNKIALYLTTVFFLAQAFFALFLVRIIKISIGLPRHYAVLDGAVATPFSFTNADQHSFPSGHTSTVTLSVSCTASVFRNYMISLYMGLLLALMGFSRIFLLMHHISDVAAGMCIGFVGNISIHYICNRKKL